MERFRSNGKGRGSSFGRYGGWFLVALLVLFCSNARRGPFQAHNTSLRPTVRTMVVEDSATRFAASLVLLLLTWWMVNTSAARVSLKSIAVSATVSPVAMAGGFGRELHTRPPPRF